MKKSGGRLRAASRVQKRRPDIISRQEENNNKRIKEREEAGLRGVLKIVRGKLQRNEVCGEGQNRLNRGLSCRGAGWDSTVP